MALSEKRRYKITASLAGALLGQSPFCSQAEAAERFMDPDKAFPDNPAMAYGRAMEAQALEEMGAESSTRFFICPDHFWLGATPDGFLPDGTPVEVKNPYGLRNDTKPRFKPISEQQHYYTQVQIQMLSTGADKILFHQQNPYGSLSEIIHRDQAWIDQYIPMLQEIYAGLMDLMDQKEHIRKLLKQREEYLRLSEEYKEAADATKDQIIQQANGLPFKIDGTSVYRVKKQGSISYAKALKKYAPDADLEPFRSKDSEYWVIK